MWQKLKWKNFSLRLELNPGRYPYATAASLIFTFILSPLVLAGLLVDPLTETNISHFTTTVLGA